MYYGESNGNTFFITETEEELSKAFVSRNQVDSILTLETDDYGNHMMRVIERDGTESNMCGNGIIVVSNVIFDKYGTSEASINTKAGCIQTRREENGYISAKMSEYSFIDEYFFNDEKIYLTHVGEPHAIRFGNPYGFDTCYEIVNQSIPHSDDLRSTFNINFVHGISGSNVDVSTFERGVNDFTKSCGTGAYCIANTIRLLKLSDELEFNINSSGGTIKVNLVDQTIASNPTYYSI